VTRFVAVIDLGKSNSKVALVDTRDAVEVEVLTQPAAVKNDGLYPCLDHQLIEKFVIDALTKIAARHPVDAITVTTHGATVALLDTAGALAMPVIDYEFQDIDAARHAYSEHRPGFTETGSPALPGGLNIGAQLYWQQANFPEKFAAVTSILTWPQYWVFVLTGELHNDVSSLGCHSDLYDPRKKRVSSLVNAMGWNKLMPPLKNSGQFSGFLHASIAKQVGLEEAVPVYTGIHDSNASLVPHLLTQKGSFSVLSTGTWFIVMAIDGEPVELDESKDTLLNVNAMGDGVPSARFMGGRERELLKPATNASEDSLSDLLGEQTNPLMLMPSTVAGTGPYPDANARWIGLDTEKNGGLRDSAIALYLALMVHECMQLVGSAGPTFIEGPLASDTQFAQMLLAVTGRAVLASDAQTGTSVGAAMLINAPLEQPIYEEVTMPAGRRDELVRYATLWLQRLQDHVK